MPGAGSGKEEAMIHDWAYLMQKLDEYWLVDGDEIKWREALHAVAFGPHGSDVLRIWWERGR